MDLLYTKNYFFLCIDDVGIKYHSKEDVIKLLSNLKTYYDITVDWTGNYYFELNRERGYNKEYVDISIPGHVTKGLCKFQHIKKK